MEVRTIKWKPIARTKFQKTIRWYLNNMGQNAARKYMSGIKQDVNRLSKQPYIGINEPLLANQQLEFHSLVSHKHTKIIYLIEEKHIVIVDLWDCRQDQSNYNL